MKTLKIAIGLSLALSFIMCNGNYEPDIVDSREVFILSYDEEKQFDDSTISFIDVVEESRCPSHSLCTWAGQVIININNQNFNLSSFQHNNSKPRKDTLDNYIYTLQDVKPYPGLVGSEIIKEDYEIKLLVEIL